MSIKMDKVGASHHEIRMEDKQSKSPSESEGELFTAKQERQLLLKQDLIILPILSLSLFFGYLVRIR